MINLIAYLKERLQEHLDIIDKDVPINEMATIVKAINWGGHFYRVAIHGPNTADRPYPHIHIYDSRDTFPYKKFNFEISLIDILCYDEINLICQQDKSNKINRKNKAKCNWNGYRKIRDGFEDWLFDKPSRAGNFNDNLEAIIHNYNEEAPLGDEDSLLNYIKDQGKKVLPKYKKYFEQ